MKNLGAIHEGDEVRTQVKRELDSALVDDEDAVDTAYCPETEPMLVKLLGGDSSSAFR